MGGRVEKGGFRLYFTGSLYAASKEFSGKDTLHTAGSSTKGIPRSPRKCEYSPQPAKFPHKAPVALGFMLLKMPGKKENTEKSV